jgi:hypothetical protein
LPCLFHGAMHNLKDLKMSFDRAKDKIKQASSKNTTLKLKGYHEVKVRLGRRVRLATPFLCSLACCLDFPLTNV